MLFFSSYNGEYYTRPSFYRFCANYAAVVTLLVALMSIFFNFTQILIPNAHHAYAISVFDAMPVVFLLAVKPLYSIVASSLLLVRYHLHVFYIAFNNGSISEFLINIMSLCYFMGLIESAQYSRFNSDGQWYWIAKKKDGCNFLHHTY